MSKCLSASRLLFSLLALFSISANAENPCEAFAKYGAFDTRSNTSDTDKAMSYRNWFCQNNFGSESDANKAGGSLGYGTFNAGYDQSRETFKQFSSSYCSDSGYASKYRNATTSYVQTISKVASDNMLACFMQPGLHVSASPTASAKTFILNARYTSDGGSDPKVTNFRVIGATCDDGIAVGKVITGAGRTALCSRRGRNEVTFVLDAERLPTWITPQTQPALNMPAASIMFNCGEGGATPINDFFATSSDAGYGNSGRQLDINAVPPSAGSGTVYVSATHLPVCKASIAREFRFTGATINFAQKPGQFYTAPDCANPWNGAPSAGDRILNNVTPTYSISPGGDYIDISLVPSDSTSCGVVNMAVSFEYKER